MRGSDKLLNVRGHKSLFPGITYQNALNWVLRCEQNSQIEASSSQLYEPNVWRRLMLVMVLNGTLHKTYERGSLGKVPQNKKNTSYT